MIVAAVKREKRMFLGIINLVILGTIIVVGLWPFDFWPENKVKWLKDQNGIRFYGRGIVFAPLPTPYPLRPFSLEIDLQPGAGPSDTTGRILSFYDGKGTETLVLTQWGTGLILQKGIQDLPEETYPKIGIRNALLKGEKRLFTIITGPEDPK
jgi:hypothetical protein